MGVRDRVGRRCPLHSVLSCGVAFKVNSDSDVFSCARMSSLMGSKLQITGERVRPVEDSAVVTLAADPLVSSNTYSFLNPNSSFLPEPSKSLDPPPAQ